LKVQKTGATTTEGPRYIFLTSTGYTHLFSDNRSLQLPYVQLWYSSGVIIWHPAPFIRDVYHAYYISGGVLHSVCDFPIKMWSYYGPFVCEFLFTIYVQ